MKIKKMKIKIQQQNEEQQLTSQKTSSLRVFDF